MTAVIWAQDGCPLCDEIKELFGEGNYEERDAMELMSGENPDIDAMAQLAMQDRALPVISIDGTFLSPATVKERFAK